MVIAVLDSGIEWDNSDLLNKHYLHIPELPAPEGWPQDADGNHRSTYDFNGDGAFNMEDWAEDPRITPDLGDNATSHPDSIKDPSDLIAYFSDGVDDDGNGYVDDIAGWDFFWNDNNPYDDTRFGHGTGESRDAAAASGEGGGLGVCPNCMVVNLRVGDSFVADVNNFALAVLYAVDNDIPVILEALGTINNTTLTVDAIDLAWDSGTLVVASAADETAYHQNMPGSNHHTLYTHAIRYDSDDREDATTWFAFSNCTNYGPRLDLSAPSTSCSSGATGVTAGSVGMVVSAAKDAEEAGTIAYPLTPSELYQLMTRTATDVALNPNDDQVRRYPSREGWDRFFGYGRVDVQAAVERVLAGDIPPEADLTSPEWFRTFEADSIEAIDVVGSAAANRSTGYAWELQVAGGWDPDDTSFVALASGSGTTPFEGTFASVPVADLPVDPDARQEPFTADDTNVTKGDKVHVHSVTFRLVVTDDEGREAVMRKVIQVQRDPSLLPGFPAKVGTGVESAPKIADVDGDGVDDLVFINSDGVVRVTDHTLTDKPGFPVTFRLLDEFDPTHPDNHLDSPSASLGAATAHHAVIGSPAVGDLDGDGDVEIVIGTLNGDLWAWHHDGAVVDGFPFMLDLGLVEGLTDPENVWDYGFFGSPALGDVDGDGDLDIVIGAMDSRVYVVDEAGELLDGWPVELRSEFGPPDDLQSRGERIISSPAVGDIDGDGFLEIAIGTNQKNAGTYGVGYVLSHDGQIEPGWPAQLFGAYTNALPYVGEGIPGSPSICDLDGDGTLEVAMHTVADPGLILNSDGTTWARMSTVASDFGFFSNSAETSFAYVFINSGSFGDFDGDGTKDYFIGAGGFAYANGLVQDGYRFDHDHLLSGWSGARPDEPNPKLSYLEPFPQIMEDLQFFLSPTIADLDNDGTPEIINGSAGNSVHAFGAGGREAEGWPKPTGQWIIASPAIGDVDGDGFLEVWTATRSGYLFAWRTAGLAATATREWTSVRHDPMNTGNCETPLRTYPVIPPGVDDAVDDLVEACEGCSSDVGASSPGAFAWLLLFPLVALRRRR